MFLFSSIVVLCFQIFPFLSIPVFLFSGVPHFRCSCFPEFLFSSFPVFLFSGAHVFRCSCFLVFLFSSIPMFLFQIILFSNASIFRCSCFQIILFSEVPVFPHSRVFVSDHPVFRCSCFPVFLFLCSCCLNAEAHRSRLCWLVLKWFDHGVISGRRPGIVWSKVTFRYALTIWDRTETRGIPRLVP